MRRTLPDVVTALLALACTLTFLWALVSRSPPAPPAVTVFVDVDAQQLRAVVRVLGSTPKRRVELHGEVRSGAGAATLADGLAVVPIAATDTEVMLSLDAPQQRHVDVRCRMPPPQHKSVTKSPPQKLVGVRAPMLSAQPQGDGVVLSAFLPSEARTVIEAVRADHVVAAMHGIADANGITQAVWRKLPAGTTAFRVGGELSGSPVLEVDAPDVHNRNTATRVLERGPHAACDATSPAPAPTRPAFEIAALLLLAAVAIRMILAVAQRRTNKATALAALGLVALFLGALDVVLRLP